MKTFTRTVHTHRLGTDETGEDNMLVVVVELNNEDDVATVRIGEHTMHPRDLMRAAALLRDRYHVPNHCPHVPNHCPDHGPLESYYGSCERPHEK